MPKAANNLTAFARRDAFEKVMFGYVSGMRRGLKFGLSGLTEERVNEHVSLKVALEHFAQEFNLPPHEFNVETNMTTYNRMVKEFWEDRKTKEEQQPA